ncbi:hypothetical protein EGJ89_10250 [Stenotrophomonas maltophilia]|nr:hypothetical protein EGJ89_10250 [Stenotrophomonas maltophilia]
MNKKSTESGEVEERTQSPVVHSFIGTFGRSRQGPLVLPKPGDVLWPDLRGNPVINAELDRLVSKDESSVDRSEPSEQAGTESEAGGALRPR